MVVLVDTSDSGTKNTGFSTLKCVFMGLKLRIFVDLLSFFAYNIGNTSVGGYVQ